jgi:hypothetical protein
VIDMGGSIACGDGGVELSPRQQQQSQLVNHGGVEVLHG